MADVPLCCIFHALYQIFLLPFLPLSHSLLSACDFILLSSLHHLSSDIFRALGAGQGPVLQI